MKKVFTLLCGLLGLAGTLQAAEANVGGVKTCKHSYVFVADEVTNNGLDKPNYKTVVGDGYFYLCGTDKQKSVSTGKGSVDLSSVDGELVTEEIAAKYGEYGSHLNSLRLKAKQDIIALNVTAQSKIIVFYENNKDAANRKPAFCNDEDYAKTWGTQNAPVTVELNAKGLGRAEWTAPDDGDVYICAGGTKGDQIYVSYIIVEANEAPGTPQIKVGPQTFENGLWFREVTCKAVDANEMPTVVTYTTDGSEPTAESTLYTAPIKCYKDMNIKFQAYYDDGNGHATEELKCEDANNEAVVSFSFDAPSLTVEGATFTIATPYENAKNYYSVNGAEVVQGNGATLETSATVVAYTEIANGEHGTFTTKTVSADVYVLNPIKKVKTIAVTGTAVVDEEATAESTTGTVYTTTDGSFDCDIMDFFVKTVEYGVLANADAAKAKYQAPEGQEVYIKMSDNTRISFRVAEGDTVDVVVVCSKNSCKNIDETDEDVNAENSKVADNRKCFINVDGTNYGGVDLKLNPEGNVVKFGLGAGIHTFQKYSGTGNILVSSINIIPVDKSAIDTLRADEAKTAAKKVFSNGRLVIKTAQGTFNAAGILVK
jgi:hypothetical protein